MRARTGGRRARKVLQIRILPSFLKRGPCGTSCLYAIRPAAVGLEIKRICRVTILKGHHFRRSFKELTAMLVMHSASRYPARLSRARLKGAKWTDSAAQAGDRNPLTDIVG